VAANGVDKADAIWWHLFGADIAGGSNGALLVSLLSLDDLVSLRYSEVTSLSPSNDGGPTVQGRPKATPATQNASHKSSGGQQ